MPPKSQAMLLNRPLSNVLSPWTGPGRTEEPLYQYGSASEKFGAVQEQETEASGTAFEQESMSLPNHVPQSVELPPPVIPVGRPTATLVTRQLWEGTVTEIKEGGFIAVLSDKTDAKNPDEQVFFDLSEISDEDQEFVRDGSSFYWVVGSERTPAGQVKNVSTVQFRRIPAWTRSALLDAQVRSRKMREIFHTERESSDAT